MYSRRLIMRIKDNNQISKVLTTLTIINRADQILAKAGGISEE